MTLLECIYQNYLYYIFQGNNFTDEGCVINVTSLIKSHIFEIDRYIINGEKCDCIIFIQNAIVNILVIEMKSYDYKLIKVKNQIQSGIDVTLDIIGYCNQDDEQYNIIPVLLHKDYMSSVKIKALLYDSRYMVTISGKKKHIKFEKCGASTSDFL